MLIEFSVENFLSIKERVTLSMVASEDISLEDNVYSADGERLLKSAIIYGPNASGKTNVLKALEFMVDYVLKPHQKGDPISSVPYKLDIGTQKQPSRFEIVFLIENTPYIYGFSVDQEKVYEEYLHFERDDKTVVIFERNNTSEFTFPEDQIEQEILSKRTLENALYLSVATQFNYEKTSKAFGWFKEVIQVETDSELPGWRFQTVQSIADNNDLRRTLTQILTSIDSEILDFDIEMQQMVMRGFKTKYRIITHHIALDDDGIPSLVEFELSDESKGTQKMFDLLGPWLQSLERGKILVLDELDTSLHPNLTTHLIKLFHDPLRNPNNAQLIFTTHNTNLLDTDLFRRDQIWFTEKQKQINGGGTKLYSLFEFDDEEKKDIERRYLVGRYGAVPLLREGLYAIPLYSDKTQLEQHQEQTDTSVQEQINDGDADNEPKNK